MPKMKVLDTRQTSEEVVVMSWSPKMDLLALGNKRGQIHLHRLSWQKVWQVQLTRKEEQAIPDLIAWHPEGIFFIVSSGEYTFVIDVETGKIAHNHELPFKISAVRWSNSQFQHPLHDILSLQSRQNPLTTITDLKIQRVESNLSVLFLGTSNGYVYMYTGGFLLGLCIKVGDSNSFPRILQIASTNNLESFIFLSDEEAGAPGKTDEMTITFSHFQNDYLSRMTSIIGPLGLKYILFLKSWSLIQTEMVSLNEVWIRIVDLYLSYMTFGATKDIETVRVDYMELLLTGISSVEMEMFLGSVGREKESKKNANVITSASVSMTEHLRTIKCSLSNMLTELNEIGGFLQYISGYEEANNVIVELRKTLSYLFLAVVQIQSIVINFSESSLNFMHLVMNTIHSYNVQEPADFIEEEADTDKVLEFLSAKVDKDIFKHLFKNVKIGHSLDKENESEKATCSMTPKKRSSKADIFNVHESQNKYKDFSNFVKSVLDKSTVMGSKGHPLLLDYSEFQVTDLIMNIVPTVDKLAKNLLAIPVLCSVPFEVDSFPIIRLPKIDYFFFENEDIVPIHLKKRKPFQLFLDLQSTFKTFLSLQLTPKKLLVFEVDFGEKTSVKSALFNFSRNILCSEIFSASHITAVSYDKEDRRIEQQDIGRTILCQIPYSSLISRGLNVDVNQLKSNKCGVKSNLPLSVQINVPVDIFNPTASCSSSIDYLLPIEGFSPSSLSVSGQRKVGALLGENKRTVILLEMELALTDSTVEDGCDDDASDS